MQLRTLGALELEGSGFRRQKPLLLLAYLALEGTKSRRHLAEVFWPAAAEPATSVRMALLQLRQGAAGSLEVEGELVRAAVGSDASRFLQLVEGRDAAAAVRLYRGAFVPHFHLNDCGVELEEWVYATRELLAAGARRALLDLAEADAAVSDFRAATGLAETALGLAGAGPPEHEVALRLYRLLTAGNSARAETVAAAAGDFGPAFELTREEARQQLQAAVPTAGGAPNNLPQRATSFVGRDPELVALARLLAEPDTRLITLAGAGGVGKTSLALQAAAGEAQEGRFRGGVYFVALESVTSPDLTVPVLASALGLKLSGEHQPLEELARHIGERHMLIVIDNFEQLSAGATVLAALVAACPGLKLLVTSRERLGLADEQLFRLGGLPLPPAGLTVAEARYQEAVSLFWQRARRARLDFGLDDATLPHVARICRLVDGLPLAIELAAAWVGLLPVEEIANELERSLNLLVSTTRTAPPRHESLRATFDHSWALLEPLERQAMRGLAVFAGGFTREAASQVVDASIARLASLVDKSLVRVVDGGRYDRHPLLYDYSREKLAAHASERERLRARHGAYFVVLAERAEQMLKGAQQSTWLERLRSESDNLRSALAWSLESGNPDDGLRIMGALWQYWPLRGHLSEWQTWYAELLGHSAAQQGTAVRAKALSGAGTLAFSLGDLAAARSLHREALVIRRELGHAWGIAASLYNIGGVHAAQGDFAAAHPLFEESLEVMRSLGNDWSVAVALSNLGLLASKLGDHRAARERHQESLTLRRGLGDALGVAESLNHLGHLALSQGDIEQAATAFHEALTIDQEAGNALGIAIAFEAFATLALMQGETRRAAHLWGAAEVLREALGAPLSELAREAQAHEVSLARDLPGGARLASAWNEGRGLTLEEAMREIGGALSRIVRTGSRAAPGTSR